MSYRVSFQRLIFFPEVPDFDGKIIPGDHQTSTVAELYIADGGDDFTKETSVNWIFSFLKHWAEKKFILQTDIV